MAATRTLSTTPSTPTTTRTGTCARCSVSPPSTADRPEPFAAVVLAGGAARRFGGRDKMLAVVGGARLIDHALTASADARQVIVVGPPRVGVPGVRWVREQPAGGGPVAALAAGLQEVEESTVVLLAADLPFVARPHVDRLLAALTPDVDGAMFVDSAQRDQPLLSAWRTASLRRVLPESPAGHALHRVLAPLAVHRIPGSDDLLDCDTPLDVEAARRRADGRREPDRQEDP